MLPPLTLGPSLKYPGEAPRLLVDSGRETKWNGATARAPGSMASYATLQTSRSPYIQQLPRYLLAYFYSALEKAAA